MYDLANRLMKPVFSFDSALNLFLGLFFLFMPERASSFLLKESLFPRYAWVILGAGFLYFAYWQIRTIIRDKLGRGAVTFSFFMAIVPAVILAILLFLLYEKISKIGFIVLLAGDIYMFLLSLLYGAILKDRWE